ATPSRSDAGGVTPPARPDAADQGPARPDRTSRRAGRAGRWCHPAASRPYSPHAPTPGECLRPGPRHLQSVIAAPEPLSVDFIADLAQQRLDVLAPAGVGAFATG